MTTKTRCEATRKFQYVDEEQAIAAALRRSRAAGPLRVYRCPACGWWHLTSQPKRALT